MDNITHALAGTLMGAATATLLERRGVTGASTTRGTALALGVVSAEFPDIDVFYSGPLLGMGKLGYLLHHRGHTHTVVFALVAALGLWLVTLALRRDLRPAAVARPLLVLATVGTLSHIALDFTNNYGVHPWWPFSNRWVYGDAVFILEPWLWIVSLPALFFVAHRTAGRVTCALLLLGIIAACWRVGLVSRGAATVATLGAIVWGLTVWRAGTPARRLMLGFAGWAGVTAVFFFTTSAARHAVLAAAGPSVVDVVVTPAPADPLCIRALVASLDGDRYELATATVTPYPGLQRWHRCADVSRVALAGVATTRPRTAEVAWESTWSGPASELRSLASTSCSAAAALRFIRIPIWRSMGANTVQLSDARFGEGAGSFASVEVPRGDAPCPRFPAPWIPPRQRLLDDNVSPPG